MSHRLDHYLSKLEGGVSTRTGPSCPPPPPGSIILITTIFFVTGPGRVII